MDNPETLATLSTHDKDKQSKTHNTVILKDEKHGPHNKRE